ncbi:hypothetical protein B0H10DRAFT_1909059 [Mycena sp. CBHHK59/15]|nr:hypothetical protein B0H10DRAFT_1909059 [Mycena sp. CBHHK59/15]
MNEQHYNALFRTISATPRRFIDTARHQSPPGLSALTDLSAVWADVPGTMELGIIDMYLSHLRADKAPKLTDPPHPWALDADFAFLAISSLARMQLLVDDPRYLSQMRAIVEAWPGIFHWCKYIHDARVVSGSAGERRMFLDGLIMLFYLFTRFNKFIVAMIDTAGCLEFVTQLWLLDDIPSGPYDLIQGPVATGALATMIKISVVLDKNDVLTRILETAGGDSDFVVQLALRRLKKATNSRAVSKPEVFGLASSHIDLLEELCAPYPDTFSRAFYNGNVITAVTNAFVSLSCIKNPTPDCVIMLTSCFSFFSRFLEGDDYLELVRTIKAGFLPAFLDCSPVFHRLPEETVGEALNIMRKVLPRYLVYRSFIEAVSSAIVKLETPHYMALIAQPLIQEGWLPFLALLAKRQVLFARFNDLKREGSPVICDNIKCQKTDLKNNFKKCAACNVVYYCSRECQRLAWKSAHRTICPLAQDQQAGESIKGHRKTDQEFLHYLASNDACDNFTFFSNLAAREFSNTPRAELMPCIDYTEVPEVFSLKVIKPGVSGHSDVIHSAADAAVGETRFQALLTKMRQDPEQAIVQSIISSGATVEILTTPIEGRNIWTDEDESESEGSESETGHDSILD